MAKRVKDVVLGWILRDTTDASALQPSVPPERREVADAQHSAIELLKTLSERLIEEDRQLHEAMRRR